MGVAVKPLSSVHGNLRQLAKYGFVGLLSNGILYVAYLLLTSFGMGHKTALTLLFAVGVTQTFLINKRWTFAHGGSRPVVYARYWAVYGIGYAINLVLLLLLVDVLGYKHQTIQALLVFFIAVLIFLLQKFWVFRDPTSDLDVQAHRDVN